MQTIHMLHAMFTQIENNSSLLEWLCVKWGSTNMGLLISVHRVQTTSMLYANNGIKLVKKIWAKQLKAMNCVQACEYKTEKKLLL